MRAICICLLLIISPNVWSQDVGDNGGPDIPKGLTCNQQANIVFMAYYEAYEKNPDMMRLQKLIQGDKVSTVDLNKLEAFFDKSIIEYQQVFQTYLQSLSLKERCKKLQELSNPERELDKKGQHYQLIIQLKKYRRMLEDGCKTLYTTKEELDTVIKTLEAIDELKAGL